jgi:hypothetical protein
MKALLPLPIVCVLAAAPVAAKCVAPLNDVRIPNGKKATMDEMVAVNHAIQENTAQVESYLHCLKDEQNARIDAIGLDITDDQRAKIVSDYASRRQAQTDKLQDLADRYDAAERTFRAKQVADKSAAEASAETAAVNAAERDAKEKARREAAEQKADEKAEKPIEPKGN